jgi:hypothetical protein
MLKYKWKEQIVEEINAFIANKVRSPEMSLMQREIRSTVLARL